MALRAVTAESTERPLDMPGAKPLWLISLIFTMGLSGHAIIISILQMRKLRFREAGLKILRGDIIRTECE